MNKLKYGMILIGWSTRKGNAFDVGGGNSLLKVALGLAHWTHREEGEILAHYLALQ